MGLILFLAFLLTPIVEIGVFVQVGGAIGLVPTLAIVILTAMLGAALWRAQGLSTWMRAQDALNRGELPLREVADGAFLIVAGALLLTPGFVTDGLGFLLFVPPFRHFLAKIVFEAMRKNVNIHVVHPGGAGRPGAGRGPGSGRGPVIDGDAVEIDEADRP